MPGRTIREAIALAVEGLEGRVGDWLGRDVIDRRHTAASNYITGWVHGYAKARGVILEDADIAAELERVIEDLRRGLPVSSRASVSFKEHEELPGELDDGMRERMEAGHG